MMVNDYLIQKYAVAAPRYTSYPTVPYWDKQSFEVAGWQKALKFCLDEHDPSAGSSIYIHLPFCESLCTYCGCNTRITKNHHVELPYIKAVITEWELYKKALGAVPLIKEIHLGGGTPTFFKPENLQLLITGILEGVHLHPQAEFSFEAHPANTTAAHLQTLYHLGFRRLSLGIQDFDPAVQLIINRIQTFEQVETVTEQARAMGYTSINFDLIYGLPLQTQTGLADTINMVGKLMPDRIAFYSYAHVPWIKPSQRKFTQNDLPNVVQKSALYELGREMLAEKGYIDIGMDHFALKTDSLYQAALKEKLHRNFMGYTHQYTPLLIGLGVSAISDAWFAYAQNVKTVEEYLELVNAGKLPIVKGHFLSAEDLIIRRHMLNIMCNGRTSWDDPRLQFNDLSNIILRLSELKDDGLIAFERMGMVVTPAGKRFLRNICMAFDARLWAAQPEKQLFSVAG